MRNTKTSPHVIRSTPGEISWTVLDPTVRVDGVAVWDEGLLLPGGEAVMARHPHLAQHFLTPAREVGLRG